MVDNKNSSYDELTTRSKLPLVVYKDFNNLDFSKLYEIESFQKILDIVKHVDLVNLILNETEIKLDEHNKRVSTFLIYPHLKDVWIKQTDALKSGTLAYAKLLKEEILILKNFIKENKKFEL